MKLKIQIAAEWGKLLKHQSRLKLIFCLTNWYSYKSSYLQLSNQGIILDFYNQVIVKNKLLYIKLSQSQEICQLLQCTYCEPLHQPNRVPSLLNVMYLPCRSSLKKMKHKLLIKRRKFCCKVFLHAANAMTDL